MDGPGFGAFRCVSLCQNVAPNCRIGTDVSHFRRLEMPLIHQRPEAPPPPNLPPPPDLWEPPELRCELLDLCELDLWLEEDPLELYELLMRASSSRILTGSMMT